MAVDLGELEAFSEDVVEVAVRRDLPTATEYGIRLNRIISAFDRQSGDMHEAQRAQLATAHEHLQAMMNCPRRMRLDDTWPNDFVIEARRTIEALRLACRTRNDQGASMLGRVDRISLPDRSSGVVGY